MAVALDTLEYARRLREAGLTEQLAEGHAQALAAAMTDSLATKADLRELETRMGARFDAMDAKFESRLDTMDAKFQSRLNAMDAKFEGRLDAMDAKFEGRLDAIDAKFEGRLDAMDAKFEGRLDGLHSSLAEFEKRLDLRLGERLADLERRTTVRLLAGIAAVSALTRLL